MLRSLVRLTELSRNRIVTPHNLVVRHMALGQGFGKDRSKPTKLGSIPDFKHAEIEDPLGYEKAKQREAQEAKMRKLYEQSKTDKRLRQELLDMELAKADPKPTDFEEKHPKLYWLFGQSFFTQWLAAGICLGVFTTAYLLWNHFAEHQDLVLKAHKLPFEGSNFYSKRIDEDASLIALNAARNMEAKNKPNSVEGAAPIRVSTENQRVILHIFKVSNVPYAQYVGNNHFIIHMNQSGKNPLDVVDKVKEDNPGLKFTYDIEY